MTKEEAVKWAGTSGMLAERLGISPSAVSQWERVPELQQYRLWRLSAGALVVDAEFEPKAPEKAA